MNNDPLTSRRLTFGAAAEAIEFYQSEGWTDGLPIVPPTAELVHSFLDKAGRSPSDIVGAEPVRGRVITAEKLAVNAVMAGCLPEHFPVVLAAVEAICEPEFNLHAVTASTMGAAMLTVINGPIATELELNSGVGVFGPGHRANATIGRALRLIVSNVTGASSGELDQATLGHAGKYSWCIAEAEDISPWQPLHVERGYTTDQSTVTVFAGLSPIQMGNQIARSPEAILSSFADGLFVAGPGQNEIIGVLAPEITGHLADAGWSKMKVKDFLFETGHRPVEEWIQRGRPPANGSLADRDSSLGIAMSPDGITLLVAGGRAGAFADIIPLWGGGSGSESVTKEIST